MIKEYATEIAEQMGIKLTSVSVVECHSDDDKGMFILILAAEGHTVNSLVSKSEFDRWLVGSDTSQLDKKIRSALQELIYACKGHPRLQLY